MESIGSDGTTNTFTSRRARSIVRCSSVSRAAEPGNHQRQKAHEQGPSRSPVERRSAMMARHITTAWQRLGAGAPGVCPAMPFSHFAVAQHFLVIGRCSSLLPHELLRIFVELPLAASRAEIVGLPLILARPCGLLRINLHPTHGISNLCSVCHGVFPSVLSSVWILQAARFSIIPY